MSKENEINYLVNEIKHLLRKLESTFWDTTVAPSEGMYDSNDYCHYELSDRKTWLYYGTKILYYNICVFLELKNLPLYQKMFVEKFSNTIENESVTVKSRAPLYSESEPTMIILDDFREFLSSFSEFDYNALRKNKTNKLRLILENTIPIIANTKTKITNETSIYRPVKWFVEIVYPSARGLNKARFIKKFKTYHPDILIPEISSAVEYKYIKRGENIDKYIDELKIDADNYTEDIDYKYFYAVVVFEDKSELNPEAFKNGIREKDFPKTWSIIAV
jgi:hypothetical protein